MSIIRHSPISLSDVIKDSNLIVEVKCLEAYKEEVPVKTSEKSSIPPFIKNGFVFSIKKVLKNTSGLKEIPETIRVPDENWRRFLSQHNEVHGNEPSRSYHVKEYETEVGSIQKASVLFLSHFQDMYDLTAKDSFDSNVVIEKVQMLLTSKKGSKF